MSQTARKQLKFDAEEFVAKWIPRLGLQHYAIEVVVPEESNGEDSGEVLSNSGYRRARLVIMPDILEDDGDLTATPDIERTVLHELLHVLFHVTHQRCKDFIRHWGGKGFAAEQQIDEISEHHEREVDQLAISLLRWDRSS